MISYWDLRREHDNKHNLSFRIKRNTIEKRLLDEAGNPNFDINFYMFNAKGEHASVSFRPSTYAICTENGPQVLPTEALLPARKRST